LTIIDVDRVSIRHTGMIILTLLLAVPLFTLLITLSDTLVKLFTAYHSFYLCYALGIIMPQTSKIIHRQLSSTLPVAVAGDGAYLIDKKGKRYIDASGGAAVSCLGHAHPDVTKAIIDQAQKLAFAHTAFFTSEPAEELAHTLVTQAPSSIEHIYFVSGGSEAIESALKIAKQYFFDKGQTQRAKFVSRRQSYHGNTLGALSISGNVWRRKPFEGLINSGFYISPCYSYRDQLQGETIDDYGRRIANELETMILHEGADTIVGFVAETVGGATGGVQTPPSGYWSRIKEICKQYEILLIADEVMCGMGRTGSMYACEQESFEPDIIAIAKGLGAGYQPIGAMLCSAEIVSTIKNASGAFLGGHTYLGHPIACAAALAVQKVIKEENLLNQVVELGSSFHRRLVDTFASHRHVGDIRGRGLFWGIELVECKSTKKPFDAQYNLHQHIKDAAMNHGLICYPGAGTIDGKSGCHILLAPPFIITETQLVEICDKLESSINQAIALIS
jgi:adenosylmethionine-8-amino-7-oxononanoate aminotransferase